MKHFYTHLKVALTFVVMLASFDGFSQNVGINSTGAAPDASAGLDVSFADKGLLIPRVALTGTADVTTIPSPTTSLMVYNTVNAGVAPNDVTPGYYYYTGTAWTRISNGSGSGWGITGNTGTNATSNFIGTTDAQDLVVKTGNTERVRIGGTSGNVGIGTEPYDESLLALDAGTLPTTTGYGTVVSVAANRNQFIEFNIENSNAGNLASADIVATNDSGSDSTHYIDLGINSSSYNNNKQNILNKPNLAYLYSNSPANFKIGNGGIGQSLIFFTNPSTGTSGNLTANGIERMRIDGNGDVGIGEFVHSNGSDLDVEFKLTVDGICAPRSGNTYTLGTSANRWSTVYGQNAFNSSSDRRLKTNIAPLSYGLKEVLSLSPVSYNWKETPSTDKKLGLIAQEVRPIIPEVVHGDEAKETLSMSYSDMVPVLINAIKEQQKQIDELKKVVVELQKK